MRTVAFYSIKGGVGKSSVAVNVAYLASQAGRRTLLLDLDTQGASSYFLNVEPVDGAGLKSLALGKNSVREHIRAADYPGLDVIPARDGLRNLDLILDKNETSFKPLVSRLSKEYDLLVIDCPPQIGLTGEAVIEASDTLLVPTVPSPLSVRTLERLEAFFERKRLDRAKIRPFVSMFDGRKKIHVQTAEDLRGGYPGCLDAVVPFSAEFEKMGVRYEPLCRYAPNGRAGASLRVLFAELLEKGLV
jgi:cellulose biosynthesis protein BcsQ